MNKGFVPLFASVMFAAALVCCEHAGGGFVRITNKSEHDITWVVIVDMGTGYAVENEKGDEVIAKNGGSKCFFPDDDGNVLRRFIACVKAQDVPELVCTAEFKLGADEDGKAFIWKGSGDDAWQPQPY